MSQKATAEGVLARAVEALAADPRVTHVVSTSRRPLSEQLRKLAVAPADGPAATATPYTFVSDGYFSMLRIPIVSGRDFRATEARSEARVAIVSAAAARTLWPGVDPVGRSIRIERPDSRPVDDLPGYTEVPIVGVAGDVVSGLVIEGQDAGHIYLPTSAYGRHADVLLVRGRSPSSLRTDTLPTILRRVHPDPLAFETLPLAEMLALQMFPLRAASWVGSVLGFLALALSVSGLYGVLVYTLSQRTREIGIRMALGATAAGVVRLVMRQAARLAGAGALVGLVLAFAALRLLGSVAALPKVAFVDISAFGAGLVIATAAGLASYFPARRASRANPSQTLRSDG